MLLQVTLKFRKHKMLSLNFKKCVRLQQWPYIHTCRSYFHTPHDYARHVARTLTAL